MHVMSAKLAWTLGLDRIFITTARKMGSDSHRGLHDYLRPLTSCESYLSDLNGPHRLFNYTWNDAHWDEYRMKEWEADNEKRLFEIDKLPQQIVYVTERAHFTVINITSLISLLLSLN